MKPQIYFSEAVPREGGPSLSEKSVSLSAGIPSEGSETVLTGGGNSKASFFYSALIHLVILSLLLGVMYQPDKRPIREVNYWVVNLVTALKEEPKGPTTISPEDQKLPTGAILPGPMKAAPASQVRNFSWNESALFQEFPGVSEPLPEQSSQQTQPALTPLEGKKIENPGQVMQASADKQIQMGQYLFGMKMGDQMMPLKIKYFQKNLRDHVFALLRTTISEEMMRPLQNQSALVEISYREDGSLQDILLSSDSHTDLADLIKDLE